LVGKDRTTSFEEEADEVWDRTKDSVRALGTQHLYLVPSLKARCVVSPVCVQGVEEEREEKARQACVRAAEEARAPPVNTSA